MHGRSQGDAAAVLMNTRVLHSPLTGVQRYVLALVGRFGEQVEACRPATAAFGGKGHAWEQFVLPGRSGAGFCSVRPSQGRWLSRTRW